MRTVFMGTPGFAVPVLTALLDAGHEVAGVHTQPDRPVGRRGRSAPSPVKEAGGKWGAGRGPSGRLAGQPPDLRARAWAANWALIMSRLA